MFPPAEFPEYRVTSLPKDHPAYTMHVTGDPKTKAQRGLGKTDVWHAHNGGRSYLFLVNDDINHLWHTNKWLTREDAFQLFGNIRNYAADRGSLPSKFRRNPADDVTPVPARGELRVGLVKFAGQGQVTLDAEPGKAKKETVPAAADWNSAAASWDDSAAWLRAVTGYEIRRTRGVSLSDASLKDHDVLHLSGRYAFKLNNEELFGLKGYLLGGGTVIIDPPGGHDIEGNRRFHESALAALRELFAENRPEDISTSHPVVTGKFAGPPGFDCAEAGYSRTTALQRPDLKTPAIRVIKIEGRPAVFLSQVDLTLGLGRQPSWEREGFAAKTARELIANILMFAKESKAAGK
jgi:hypothetical protein